MDNSLDNLSPRSQKNSVFAYIGVLILALVIIFIIAKNNPKVSNPPSPNASLVSQHPLPTRLSKAPPTTGNFFSFQACNIKKENNPLIKDVITVGTDIIGFFYGNINQINLQPSNTAASIELISPKGDQLYDFNVADENGLVSDATVQKDLKLADLKQGQTVIVSFNCFPNQNNKFKITKISVVGK